MKMSKGIFTAAVLFLSLTPASQAAPDAKAVIQNAKGEVIGEASFSQTRAGVRMKVEAKDLQPGNHGIHIHNAAKCEAPDFKSAGPHFNPMGKQHGLHNPSGHHAGDIPNLKAGKKGKAKLKTTLKNVTLEPDTENSLFHEGGTALVIHASGDDGKSDPAGNSGDRIACGTIEKI